MAVKTWDEIYSSLSADEKKVFDSVNAREPEFKAGWTRHDDYSRKTQELAAERKKLETDLEYAQRMKVWAEENVPKYDSLVEKGIISEDGEELWTAKQADLERQLEEARKAAVGGEMDPAELDKRVREIVKANGGVTPEELKALIVSEGKKLAEETFNEQWKAKETDFNTKTIPMVGGFSAANSIVAMHWEKETGKTWTAEEQKAFYELMSKEGNFDPFKMEEKLLAPIRAEKDAEKKIEEEVQKRLSARGLPGGGGEDGRYIPSPDEPKGSLQQTLEREGATSDFESLIKAQAVLASKELVAEGKG